MKLDTSNWQEFLVGRIFRIEPTKGQDSTELILGNDISYIGAKHDDNGLMMKCKLQEFESWVSKGNCIVFIQLGAGSAGYVNYMPHNFIGMSGKTACGYIDGIMNQYIGEFLATILCLERPKYSFGRSWTGERLTNTIVKLPIKKDSHGIPVVDEDKKWSDMGYIPDWQFMEDYIKSLHYKPLTTNAKKSTYELHLDGWREFKLSKFFTLENGKKYPSDVREIGALPLVSTSGEHNGISDYIEQRSDHVHSNFLTVAYSGSVGATFYHQENVFVGETVFALLPTLEFNQYLGMFFATILNFENFRYSYGRKIIGSKYGDSILRLPICFEADGITPKKDESCKWSEDGYIPNFQFMEEYIKSLPYGDRL